MLLKKVKITSWVIGIFSLFCAVISLPAIYNCRCLINEVFEGEGKWAYTLLAKAICGCPAILLSAIFIVLGLIAIAKDLVAVKDYFNVIIFVAIIIYITLLVIGNYQPIYTMSNYKLGG